MHGGGINPIPDPDLVTYGIAERLSNAIWRYDLVAHNWALIRSNRGSATNLYGAVGVYSSKNDPGGRWGHACTRDSQGVLWVSMGYPLGGEFSDLWSLRISDTTPEWAFWGELSPSTAPKESTDTAPGGRDNHAAWIDASDVMWFYGGNAVGARDLGDMWFLDLRKLAESPPALPAYQLVFLCNSTLCSANATYPGSRGFAASWTDPTRTTLYLYGGRIGSGVTAAHYSDLWAFDVATLKWTQVSGDATFAPSTYYNRPRIVSTPVGQASLSNYPGARRSAAAAVGTNQVLIFGGYGAADSTALLPLGDLWSVSLCGCPAGFYGADCSCTSPPPITGAVCYQSVYTVPGTINVGGAVPLGNNTVVVSGSLVIESGTVIEVAPGGSIQVQECLTLTGQVTISVNLPSEPQPGTTLQVLTSNCTEGNVSDVVVTPRYKAACSRRVVGDASSDSSGVSVLLTVTDNCHASKTALIVGVTVGATVGLVIVVVIVVLVLVKRNVINLRRQRGRRKSSVVYEHE